MSSAEFNDSVCRICLDENVVLDWNNTLVDYCDVTYKDCYYKYTQLKPLDADPFSYMLCENCSNSLENVHALIIKALDSYNFLLEVNCMNSDVEDSIIMEDDVNYSTDFEAVLLEKPDIEYVIQEDYDYESFDEESMKPEEIQFQEIDIEYENEESTIDQSFEVSTNDNVSKSMNSVCRKSKRVSSSKREGRYGATCFEENNYTKVKASARTRHKKEQKKELKNELNDSKNKRRKAKTKQELVPCMCSFCSKILHSKYALQKHERTHIANRERKAPCPICGVKFLEESYVKTHMQIHNENRVKKHKCEFCDKSFFEKGSLNVHRRIHLGTMIPCSLCSKEFFRQVDLDIHMNSHSATLLNGETKKRSRYWVRCKYCDKNIMSTSFKSHTAVHLNEPLMKCSICNKEFFRRDSCTEHIKMVHKKKDYNDFIILYKKNRLSHLYLKQTTEIRVNED